MTFKHQRIWGHARSRKEFDCMRCFVFEGSTQTVPRSHTSISFKRNEIRIEMGPLPCPALGRHLSDVEIVGNGLSGLKISLSDVVRCVLTRGATIPLLMSKSYLIYFWKLLVAFLFMLFLFSPLGGNEIHECNEMYRKGGRCDMKWHHRWEPNKWGVN